MEKRIVLAADDLTIEQLLALLKVVGSRLYAVKIHNLYDEHGPRIIEWLKNYEPKVWVDAKLHDIPATVAKRAAVFKRAGADILTVHASGDVGMMRAAIEHGPPEIYAVSILTSFSEVQARNIYHRSIGGLVSDLFEFMDRALVHGVVCSPQETTLLRQLLSERPLLQRKPDWSPKLVTPGIRSAGKEANDQQRIATPAEAIRNGSDLLVIGRQITTAPDPLKALEKIEREMAEVLLKKEGVSC